MTAAVKSTYITLLLVIAAFILHCWPSASEISSFHRTASSTSAWWLSLVTCHWTHWSTNHFLWDVGMFGSLGVFCERYDRRSYVTVLLLGIISIPMSIYFLRPDITQYRGLSGLDTALYALLVSQMLIASHAKKDDVGVVIFCMMFGCMLLKIAAECVVGTNLFVNDDGFTPVVLAHVVGSAVGLSVSVLTHYLEHANKLRCAHRTVANQPASIRHVCDAG